jgi:ABC-type transport system substrate-binding protein
MDGAGAFFGVLGRSREDGSRTLSGQLVGDKKWELGGKMATDSKSWLARYGSSPLTRRRLLKGSAAGAGAVALIACGGGSDGTGLKLDDAGSAREPGSVWFARNDWRLADESKQAVPGGIYRSSLSSDLPSHLDPIPQVDSGSPTARHTYEFLMALNRGPGIEPGTEAYANPVGGLAESWEVSPDATTYTFRMRQGVKFQNIAPVNGRIMDIDDWKSTHDRHMASSAYRTVLGETLDKVEYPDSRTMVWRFKFPYQPIVYQIFDQSFYSELMPKELNANPSLAEKTAIGTGYKILDKNEPSVRIEYRKNPDYWGGDPYIERWHQPIIPEYANRYAQFVSGNIIDFTPNARDILLLHKDAPEAVVVGNDIPRNGVGIHKWGRVNPQTSNYKDARVRIAFRRSIDYQAIMRFVSNQEQLEANGIPVELSIMTHMLQDPSYWLNPEKGELGALSQNYIFNIAEAKKLTAAAGYNSPVEIDYFIESGDNDLDREQLTHKYLRESGVFNINFHLIPDAEYRTKYNVNLDYTGVSTASEASGRNLDYYLFRFYHKTRGGDGQGFLAFTDPKMDSLVEQQRREVDFDKRVNLIKDIQMYLAETFYQNPARSLFTTYSFRWPWVHNQQYMGEWPGLGGHLQWLDESMPRRNERV